MANFWRILHEKWNDMSPLEAAAFALWGVNYIHPFAEGNGRSSRALAYFIICVKLDYWLPGSDTITEQIRIVHRSNYCEILNRMDKAMKSDGTTDLTEMVALLDQLMLVQLRSAP